MTLQTLQLNSNSWYESAKAAMLAAGKSYTSNRQLTLHKSSYHTLRFLTFPGFDLTFLDLISSQKSSTPTHGVATFVTGLVCTVAYSVLWTSQPLFYFQGQPFHWTSY